MKHIIQMLNVSELFRHKPSLRAFLKLVGLSSLLVCLLLIFSTVSPSTPLSHQSPVAPASQRQATPIPSPAAFTPSSADIVLVIDNINEIQSHDPTDGRFMAARIFVNQAPLGDRIGVVRIPSSDKPSPVKLLDLTTIRNSNDRNIVEQVLTPSFFGPVDPGPAAYFVPAIQAAEQMLLSVQDKHPKYIIVLTDSLMQSGDHKPCAAAPDQYHQWFCEIPMLESQHISVIVFAFTTPGREAELQPMRQNLKQSGAILLQVG